MSTYLTLTEVANLALDHIGEPYLAAYESDSGVTAEAVRLHLPMAVNTILEGHVWSFATRIAELSLTSDEVPEDPSWTACYDLPSDCLRVIKVNGVDVDVPENFFVIRGRYLLLAEEPDEGPLIDYITDEADVEDWPATFIDAVSHLLASKLAPKLAQDQAMATGQLQLHDLALGKARSKDARETRSNENSGPRKLAARSSLVNARYGPNHPPY